MPHSDEYYMNLALALARRGMGVTAPNPSVGCVIVHDGIIIGRGVTAPGGRPHAETIALAQAGSRAQGATAYITLEPCSHYGKTPPCAQALIAAGITRVAIATKDSNPNVSGKGIQMLQEAGVTISLNLGEAEAREINEGFFKVQEEGRPMVTLKLATTLDGKIAMPSGESKWVTGEQSRHYAHWLRAQHDAIMVGITTVKTDDPELTCRLPGLFSRNPMRIVMDSTLALPRDAKLVTTAHETPTWVLTTQTKGTFPSSVTIHTIAADNNGRIDISAALALLAKQGITRVLVEGGATLAASLLKAKLVDRLVWFHAPKIIGSHGIPGIGTLNETLLAAVPQFKRNSVRALGEDIVETYTATKTPGR